MEESFDGKVPLKSGRPVFGPEALALQNRNHILLFNIWFPRRSPRSSANGWRATRPWLWSGRANAVKRPWRGRSAGDTSTSNRKGTGCDWTWSGRTWSRQIAGCTRRGAGMAGRVPAPARRDRCRPPPHRTISAAGVRLAIVDGRSGRVVGWTPVAGGIDAVKLERVADEGRAEPALVVRRLPRWRRLGSHATLVGNSTT